MFVQAFNRNLIVHLTPTFYLNKKRTFSRPFQFYIFIQSYRRQTVEIYLHNSFNKKQSQNMSKCKELFQQKVKLILGCNPV